MVLVPWLVHLAALILAASTEGLAIQVVSQISSVQLMVQDSPAIHRAMEASRLVIHLVALRTVNLPVIQWASRGNPTVIQMEVLNLDHLQAIPRVVLPPVIHLAGNSLVPPQVIQLAGSRLVILLAEQNLVHLLVIHLAVPPQVIHLAGRRLDHQRAIPRVVHKG